MTLFQNLFLESKAQPVLYNGQMIYLSDVIDVLYGQSISIVFESSNSNWVQGVHASTEGEFEVAGKVIKRAIVLWENTAPKEVIVKCRTKNGKIRVKNVWNTGNGIMHSCHGGAAMIIERIGVQARYRCNDGHDDENFDDLVFSIKHISNQ